MTAQLHTIPPDPAPAPPAPSEIQGVVDNIAAGRVFGWAWNPSQPEERVTIELRLGQTIVAQVLAAQERADLKGAGIGDGCHAYELRLTPELIERRAELFVVARSGDGLEVPLPILGARRALAVVPDAKPDPSLTRAVRSLAGAQRELAERMTSLAGHLPGTAATAEALGQRIETLEAWCLRLDDRLAALSGEAPQAAPKRRLDPWQIILVALAAVAVAGGVALAWIGAFPTGGGR